MNGTVKGIHHITALAGDPSVNLAFYRETLGLRLVKRTVNFDEPGTWHLYFGDSAGSPGTILTFFPLGQGIPRGYPGFGTVSAIAFNAPEGSFDYWSRRLAAAGVITDQPDERFGERMLGFADPDGLRLELIFSSGGQDQHAWSDGAVPAEQALTGFQGATLLLAETTPTADILTGVLGFARGDSENGRTRYATGDSGPGATLDIVTSGIPGFPTMGPGVTHHIAFRAADSTAQATQASALTEIGLHVTGVRDRKYFRSVYFREPGGVLFEIATDGPGFAVDESLDALGSSLKLPGGLESQRAEIEAALPPLEPEHAGNTGRT
jgi:glyoxalase family protein